MEYRKVGRTGRDVSVIGLGTEYLFKKAHRQSSDKVIEVVGAALDNGINYIDLVFGIEDFLADISEGLGDRRDKVMLTSHLGSGDRDGNYKRTRKASEAERIFERSLEIFDRDYMDIANVHYVKDIDEYREVTAPGGLLDLALKLREDGRARMVGISTHDTEVGLRAAGTGNFDMLMFQVNMANNAMPGRNDMLSACARNGVGVVAMKIFSGGKLLRAKKNVNFPRHHMGGPRMGNKDVPGNITAARCIHYSLSQPGVCTVVPGVKSMKELEDCLGYLETRYEDRDYSECLMQFNVYAAGECQYCNHCLPCPAGIDIGQTFRFHDMAAEGMTQKLRNAYLDMPRTAGACTSCGACDKRCPFDVKAADKMRECADLFGG